MNNTKDEIRIIIRVQVNNLPGDPNRRHLTIGELFSEKVLFRPIDYTIRPDGYDNVVIPPGFDSDKPVNRWFIIDLNVKGPKTRAELLDTPHKVYLACKNDDNWTFVPRDIWIESAKKQCDNFTWGGKVEQGWLAQAKNELTKNG